MVGKSKGLRSQICQLPDNSSIWTKKLSQLSGDFGIALSDCKKLMWTKERSESSEEFSWKFHSLHLRSAKFHRKAQWLCLRSAKCPTLDDSRKRCGDAATTEKYSQGYKPNREKNLGINLVIGRRSITKTMLRQLLWQLFILSVTAHKNGVLWIISCQVTMTIT